MLRKNRERLENSDLEDQSDKDAAKEHWQPTEAGRGQKGVTSRASTGSSTLPNSIHTSDTNFGLLASGTVMQ